MSTVDVNPYIFNIDTNGKQIPIIEGSCEKYCITTGYEEKKHYCKFSKFDEVFAEVFTSHVLGDIGFPTVPYIFAVENFDGKKRVGTVSDDFAEGVSYRASLDSMAEKTDMINSNDFTEHIYISLPKAMSVLDKFCKMHYIKLSESERNQIQSQLESQIVIDYCFCNSDHHLKNTEFLIYSKKGVKEIKLAPMFDLGQCLRGVDVQMAFTFSDLAEEGAELARRGYSKEEMYAGHILRYYKEKYSSPKDLANDYSFRLLRYFQELNIDEEMFKFLCNCNDKYRHYKNNKLDQIKGENYYGLIELLADDIKQNFELNEEFSWVRMRDAFEERKRLITEGLSNDEFLSQACKMSKKLHYNLPESTQDSQEKYYY